MMDLSPIHVSFVVACSALVAAAIAPIVNLAVSRRQLHATVVSANREKWIGKLRETTAELISRLALLSVEKARSGGDWNGGRALLDVDAGRVAAVQRVVQLYWELTLLTNPRDDLHDALRREVGAIVARLRRDAEDAPIAAADLDRVAAAAQAVIGAEWRRVKRGT